MGTLAELRQQFPYLEQWSDTDIIAQISRATGEPMESLAAEFGFGTHNPARNPLAAGVASGVDQLQGLAGSFGAAVADSVGLDSVTGALNRYAENQQLEGYIAGRPDLERIEDQSFSSALPYIGYQVTKQLPNLAAAAAAMATPLPGDEAAVLAAIGRGMAGAPRSIGGGGLQAGASFAERRAALEAGQGLVRDTYRATAGMYPMGVGSLYQESVDAGDPDPYGALVGGVPYGAAESLLPAWLKGSLGRTGSGFAGNMATRMGKSAALAGAGEMGVELAQNEMEMMFNPTLSEDEIASRRLNSAVAGGLVGGAFGSLGGVRPRIERAVPTDLLDASPAPAAGLLPHYAHPTMTVYPDGSVGTGRAMEGWDLAATDAAKYDRDLRDAYAMNADIDAERRSPQNPVAWPPQHAPGGMSFDAMGANVNVPMPVDTGSAVAVLNMARTQPVIVGTPLHAAVVEAGRILDADGLRAPETVRQAPNMEAAVAAAEEVGLVPTPKQALAEVASAAQDGIIDKKAKNELVALATKSPAEALARVAALRQEDAATTVALPSPEELLAKGYVKKITYDGDGKEIVEWIKPTVRNEGHGQRVNKFAVPEATDLQDEDAVRSYLSAAIPDNHRDAVEAYLGSVRDASGLGLRPIAKSYGISYQTLQNAVATAKAAVRAVADKAGVSEEYANELLGFTGPEIADMATVPEAGAIQAGLTFRRGSGPRTVRAWADEADPEAGYSRSEFVEDSEGDIGEAQKQEAETEIEEDAGVYGVSTSTIIEAAAAYDEFVHHARRRGESVPSSEELTVLQAEAVLSVFTSKRDGNTNELWDGFREALDAEEGDGDHGQAGDNATGESGRGSSELSALEGDVEAPTYSTPKPTKRPVVETKRRRRTAEATARAGEGDGGTVQAEGTEARVEEPAISGESQEAQPAATTITSTEAGMGSGEDADADLLGALQRLAKTKEHKALATDYIRRAMFAVGDEAAAVRKEAGEWVNAVEGDRPGAAKFSLLASSGNTVSYFTATPAETRFFKSGEFQAYLKDFMAERGLLWWQRPDVSVFDGQIVVPSQDVALMREFSDWLANATDGRGGIPPQMRDGTFHRELLKAKTAPASGAAKFSATEKTSGQAAAALRAKLLKVFSSPYFFDKAVGIVDSTDQLPPAARKDIQSTAGRVQGFYDPNTKKVWLLAQNIPEGRELAVLLHEVGVHMGMKNLLGSANYDKLVTQLQAWVLDGTGREGELARKARDRVRSAETKLGHKLAQEDFNEELLAYFVEEAVNAGVNPTATGRGTLAQWFRTLWAAVKVAVRKLGMDPDGLTAQNVIDLAYGAARMELNAAWHGTAADFRRFDHKYMGSGEGAQAFGWGTYLAQRVGIGKEYWKADVARKTNILDGVRLVNQYGNDHVISSGAEHRAWRYIREFGGDLVTANEKLLDKLDKNPEVTEKDKDTSYRDAQALEVIESWMEDGFTVESVTKGSLMRVDTAIQDDELLDWDKPLSEQSEKVKKALMPLRKFLAHTADELTGGANWNDMTGEEMYRLVQRALQQDYFDPNLPKVDGALRQGKTDQAASEYLDSIGIKGIKFLDAVSRNKGEYSFGMRQDGDKWFAWAEEGDDPREVLEFETKAEAEAGVERLKEKYSLQTRNIVVFNDKNIHRVFTEVGANPESRKFSVASDTVAKETFFDRLSEAVPFVRQNITRWMSMHQLADRFKELKSVREFTDVIVAMGARNEHIKLDYSRVQDRIAKLSKDEQKKLYEAMIESTMAGVDRTAGLAPDTLTAYNDAKAVFKKYWGMRRARLKELGVTDLPEIKGPYFPLMRFGKYVVAWKSPEFEAAKARGDTATVERMKAEEKHYKVAFFETLGAATRQGERWGGVKPVLREEYVRNAMPVNSAFLKEVQEKLEAKLGKKKADGTYTVDEATRALIRDVQDIYYASLPDVSAMKREMKRMNVRGAKPEEMMRAFSQAAISDAFHIARLEQGDKLTDALYKVKEESRATGSVDHQAVYNTLREKYGLMMSRKEPTPIIDFLRNMTYLTALGSSPAFVAINATQPWLVTLPMLAGRYGNRRSAQELKRALGQASQYVYAKLKQGARFELDFDDPAFVRLVPDERERAMLKSMLDRGQIDITIGTDLAAEAKGDTAASRMMRWFTFLPHQIETVNRIGTALAAYRMAAADTKRYGETADIEAQKYAYKMLYDTQIDYSNEAAAVMMDTGKFGGLGKLFFQFRKYQQGMAYLIFTNAKDAFGHGASKEQQAEARRALFSMLSLAFVSSGSAGLPFAMPISVLAGIAAAAWPDDDEPEPEAMWRKFLTDVFGEEGGLVAAKGFPALFGGDISQRVGFGNIFNPTPFLEWRGSMKDSLKEYLAFGIMPASGTISKFAQGLDALGSHEYAKAMQYLTPKILADAVKGAQLDEQGIRTKYGNTAVAPEEFSAFDVLLQGMGITPTKKSEYWDRQAVVSAKEQEIKDARNKLVAEYVDAKKGGDTADAMAAIEEFNARHPKKPYRIDRSTLLKSEQQRKRTMRTEGGIGYRKGEEWKAELTDW